MKEIDLNNINEKWAIMGLLRYTGTDFIELTSSSGTSVLAMYNSCKVLAALKKLYYKGKKVELYDAKKNSDACIVRECFLSFGINQLPNDVDIQTYILDDMARRDGLGVSFIDTFDGYGGKYKYMTEQYIQYNTTLGEVKSNSAANILKKAREHYLNNASA